ncbi:MAG: chorismate mutase [Thermoleophilia bacterium]
MNPIGLPKSVRAVRGATTVEADTSEQIKVRTTELLEQILQRNNIENEDLISIIFTATPDLASDFPAAAARGLGLSDVPLLCSQELAVKGAVERCIRVLIHFQTRLERSRVRHVYLHNAKQLRLDLPE